MDINELEKIVRGLAEEQIPVLGVVGVVGSTEEGAVDSIDKIIALRDELMKDGIYYYVHVDAAYGGYGRAIFLDEDNNFILTKIYKMFTKNTGLQREKRTHFKRSV
ncbi:L-tyrosine decarboxylase [Enterococcus faecalis]|uniref:L-tyrosine decarboxylase n=1 Tax=Enterococcus faecalis TaxID=1351 RepID=A0AAX2KW97_ENTFL|nr:L-tyrosine decarboxylase [Enterococcus faecalis]